ncbi:MAG TPA: polysaccharide biosynthesis tyrosine autokinase [Candidatus Prevotella stercoripullorum]|nr:polysaccharide biosynthesis tyrosine autokinase [Candidatus Prevotella stercoripullorum]
MNELRNDQQIQETNEEQSSFNFQTIYTAFVLNWKWFLLSIFICLGIGFLYLRYATPVYNTTAKLLIKDDKNDNGGSGGALQALESMSNLGFISSNYGTENEQEILTSTTIAEQAIRDLKLYANYYIKGSVKKELVYKEQPINVEMDAPHLEKLDAPLELKITRDNDSYKITGTYYIAENEVSFTGPYDIEKNISSLPAVIRTQVGTLTLTKNGNRTLEDGETEFVDMLSPRLTSHLYIKKLSVEQTSKTSSVFSLQINDENISRSIDYLNQMVTCYNRQANEDKNEIAVRTEEFINDRLAKIDAELSSTDGALESYKKRNKLMELQLDAMTTSENTSTYEQKLNEANTQISLIGSLINFANRPGNRHQVLPSNIGLQDEASTSLINEYNKIALERNRLLRTASENSPVVIELTSQLDNMQASIHQALEQARKGLIIQRDAIRRQLGRYDTQVTKAPEQERILTQIGRQQEVRSGLYLMLLQKREENSISLAATADKSKLIEKPQFNKKISPKGSIVMLIALIMGIAIPSGLLYVINFFRYRIEGHEDVASLTKLPIIADIVVASDTAKTRADIVVHENQNNQMEEIFRSMRTNIQFMLKPGQNVILFTSSTSGEGKTFTAANLAVSFALLGKKVILIGLDIRKPRLAELFRINNYTSGITNLLVMDNPQWGDIEKQIVPSEINGKLDLLMAGPIPPNPAELVSRPALEQVITQIKQHYDYVLIDTAPVGLVTDTLQIGKLADISIYMCRADYTPKASFNMINSLAEENKLANMCIAINGIDLSEKKYGYYYGYGKYGKYGRYGHYGKGSSYGHYGSYGDYANSHYGNKNDNSVKR